METIDDSQKKTVFGTDALTLPTPDKVKAIFKVITFFTVLIPVVVTGVTHIPVDLKAQILEYTGVVVLALQKAEDFWGIKIS